MKTHQLTKEQAIAIAEDGMWKEWTDEEIVGFQLFQKYFCMDFSRFHEAIQKVLKRSVFTHEFALIDILQKEYLGEKLPPTFEDIQSIIPKEKRIILQVSKRIKNE